MTATDGQGPDADRVMAPMTSKTLDRGLRVLGLVARGPERGLSVAELAAQLELHRAQVYRLLGTLAEHRLVRRGGDGRYLLGVGVAELAGRTMAPLQSAAMPALHALAEDLGATAFLSVADADEVVAVAVVEPMRTAFHVAYRVGYRHAIDRGAPGLAILAGRPPSAGDGPGVRQARELGYATTRGELEAGAMGLAAPIARAAGVEASIGIVTIDGKLDATAAGERVIEAARAIGAAVTGSA